MAKSKRKKGEFGKFIAILIVIVILAAIIFGVVYYIKNPDGVNDFIQNAFHKEVNTPEEGGDSAGGGTAGNAGNAGGGSSGGGAGDSGDTQTGETEMGDVGEILTADLSIHFLELGNKYAGDCILIKCGETEVLIDAGSRAACAPTLISYIDDYCTDGTLEYVIATHSDQDHISAFAGNKSGSTRTGVLYHYSVGTLIRFDNVKSTTSTTTTFLDAVDYCAETYGTAVYTASECYDETDGAQRQYFLDDDKSVSINILYNYYYYNTDTSDNNNHSVVTLLTQETDEGRLNYLFTGDLEQEGEEKMVEYYKNVPEDHRTGYNVLPSNVELYKAGHHGSKTSSNACLMEVIQPKNVAVCCCCGSTEYTTTDANTFPTQAMISNVAPYTENIYVTSLAVFDEDGSYDCASMNGNIVFYYSGGLKLYCSNNYTKLKDTEWFAEHRVWG